MPIAHGPGGERFERRRLAIACTGLRTARGHDMRAERSRVPDANWDTPRDDRVCILDLLEIDIPEYPATAVRYLIQPLATLETATPGHCV